MSEERKSYFWFDLNPLRFDLAAAKCLRDRDYQRGLQDLSRGHVSMGGLETCVPVELSAELDAVKQLRRLWLKIYAARFFHRSGVERFPDRFVLLNPSSTAYAKVDAWCNLFAIRKAEIGGSRRYWRWGAYCPFQYGILYPFVRLHMQLNAERVCDMKCLFPSMSSKVMHLKSLYVDNRMRLAFDLGGVGETMLYAKRYVALSVAWVKAAIVDGNKGMMRVLLSDKKRLFSLISPRELLCYLCANANQGIEEECCKLLELIAEEDADAVRKRDLFGWSPLTYTLFRSKNQEYAISPREIQMRQFDHRLIELGCDPNEKDEFGVSWRMVASRIYTK